MFSILPFVAAALSLIVGVASVTRKKPSPATWCFFAGMVVLGMESIVTGLTLRATQVDDVVRLLTLGLVVKSFIPVTWLGFSLTYSRGNYRETAARWGIPLTVVGLLTTGLTLGFREQLIQVAPAGPAGEVLLRFGPIAHALNVILLVTVVLVLLNMEQTFRSAVGTMRWRIKFVVLGLAVIFGGQFYVRSQVVLFATYTPAWAGVESSALLIGCLFLVVAYARAGSAEIDVYPSRAVLRSSLTVLIAGGYLVIVGVLAQVVKTLGGAESFQFQAFVVLLGMAGLAVLLLSDRLRQRIRAFVGRHFAKAQHDSVGIWTGFSRRLATVKDQTELCTASARSISETFEVLSVTIWLLDENDGQFTAAAGTPPPRGEARFLTTAASASVRAGLQASPAAFDLEEVKDKWAAELRQANSAHFGNGGARCCVPLRTGSEILGAIVLADRVNGAGFTPEELALLQCIADQMTSALLNLRLGDEVARAREMEAFRTMSAFFVHDLKNAASSLNLMLKNLPVHFDDPAFRQDALRGIGNTARRIDEMIARLTALRQGPAVERTETDLNQVVGEALDRLNGMPNVELIRDFQPLAPTLADREQIQSVVTNLVLNARDAVAPGGHIHVRTERLGSSVVLAVTDDGCGMSAAFLKDSLFRPFQSTKKKGLGIGMFQSRMIVEAHGGSIRVESETGKGTTFRVSLPAKT